MMADLVVRDVPQPDDFAPFGEFIDRPDTIGTRRYFSRWLGGKAGLEPVFHTNAVAPVQLPLTLQTLESHPHAAQCFIPLDVSRYLVTVAESDAAGQPLLQTLRSFALPGTLGVIYAPGVWHAPASTLDRPGHFAVLMWRGLPDDDVLTAISGYRIVAASDRDHRPAQDKAVP